jgi:hypothetical protein
VKIIFKSCPEVGYGLDPPVVVDIAALGYGSLIKWKISPIWGEHVAQKHENGI